MPTARPLFFRQQKIAQKEITSQSQPAFKTKRLFLRQNDKVLVNLTTVELQWLEHLWDHDI